MEGKAGAPVKIAGFVRYALGEGGIEKKVDDFAAEVAAQAKGWIARGRPLPVLAKFPRGGFHIRPFL